MHSTLVQRFFTSIALLALVALLAFGGGIRYLCYCTGETVVTVHEDCHGHGLDDHDDGDHPVEGDDHGDHDHGDHDHELVKTSTDLRAPSNAAAPELKWQPLEWTPLLAELSSLLSPRETEPLSSSLLDDPPPPSLLVARSVVFLI